MCCRLVFSLHPPPVKGSTATAKASTDDMSQNNVMNVVHHKTLSNVEAVSKDMGGNGLAAWVEIYDRKQKRWVAVDVVRGLGDRSIISTY